MKNYIRVIHVVRSLKAGGIVAFILSVYEKIHKQVCFDFIVDENDRGIYADKIEELGGKLYFLRKENNIKLNQLQVLSKTNKILKANYPYDVFHVHYYFANPYFCFIALLNHIPIRISHCHNTRFEIPNIYVRVYEKISSYLFNAFCTSLLGCSDVAASFLYGEKKVLSGRAITLYNGIDLDKFCKSRYDATKIKQEFNIMPNIKVITYIGRLEKQKNPLFIPKIINELKETNRNFICIIVGEGSLKSEMISLVRKFKLEDYFLFLPQNSEIPNILSISDVFLLPSFFEGFPIVLLEAQAFQIPCIISSNITEEIDLGYCCYITLNHNEREWAIIVNKYLLESLKNISSRKKKSIEDFNITNIAQKVLKLYQNKGE